MSFLGTITNIGKTLLQVASNPLVESGISMWNPAVGVIWKRVASSIVNIEAAHAAAGKTGTGADKLAFVTTDFEESISVTQEILRSQGKSFTYDTGALKEAIDAQVMAYNAFARVKASFKITDVPVA